MTANLYSSRLLWTTLSVWVAVVSLANSDDQELLAIIAETGPQGTGSPAARAARDELAQRDVEILPSLLLAMDTSNPVAANWYRTVFEEVVARELQESGTNWPIEFLKMYVSDPQREGRPRRLVLSLIVRLEPDFRNQWLSERLTDPEFRREAVDLALQAGEQALSAEDAETAVVHFRKAFENARDRTQVTRSADRLQSVGETADVIKHLGLVTDWWLVGPFDAPDKTGFGLALDVERKISLQARYRGQNDAEFGWIRHQTADPLGQLNLVTALGRTDEAVAYAWTEISVEQDRHAQLRCGADDCCLVWLNDEVVSPHEQWLNGTRFDRFADAIRLVAGRNTILVKVCQGPQHRNPDVFNNWSLQLRLCDEEGRGIPFETMLPSTVPK